MWATPIAANAKGTSRPPSPGGGSRDLRQDVRMFPTPTATDNNAQVRGHGKTEGTKRGTTLAGLARMWPTPMAHEARLGYQDRSRGKKGSQESLTTVVINEEGGRQMVSGQLNPQFVEWLMGYPEGWTELRD